jgi:hypothetical protein
MSCRTISKSMPTIVFIASIHRACVAVETGELPMRISGLLVSLFRQPCRLADRFGMGQAGRFHAPSTAFVPPNLSVSSPSRVPFRSAARHSLFAVGSGGVWIAPPQVIVVPVFVQPVPSEAPAPALVPDPKFVSPATQSAPSTSGPHTVIVQRGARRRYGDRRQTLEPCRGRRSGWGYSGGRVRTPLQVDLLGVIQSRPVRVTALRGVDVGIA